MSSAGGVRSHAASTVRDRHKLGLLLWGAYSIVTIAGPVIGMLPEGGGLQISMRIAFMAGVRMVFFLAMTPALIHIAQLFPVEPPHRARNLGIHVTAVLGFLVGYTAWSAAAMTIFARVPEIQFWWLLQDFANDVVLYYMAILGLSFAMDYYHRHLQQQLAGAALEAALARSQVQVLKAQIQPHFLFNTLHAVSALVRDDPEAADRMISQLGELLRRTMAESSLQEVPLHSEIETLNLYLDIQRIRYQSWLDIELRLHKATLDALVPSFILQPLVENAIRHGVVPTERPGRIRISAGRRDDQLVLRVRDNGASLQRDQGVQYGMGLTNIATRLHQLYGDRASLTLEPARRRGAVATIVVPYITADAARPQDWPASRRALAGTKQPPQ